MSAPKTTLPPLENGDRLTADEFHRRYAAMPHLKKAELIAGEVVMGSPVSQEGHGGPHVEVATWAGVYKAHTPGVDAGDNATARLDKDNEPQPDVMLFVRPDHGGRVRLTKKGYVRGAPELVFEVSATTASIDLNRKLEMYQKHKAAEYVVWRVREDAVDWFVLRHGRYAPHAPNPEDGLLRSEAFPGLWLDASALVRRDLAAVLAALACGVQSSEHAAFVTRLSAARTSN